MTSRGHLEGLGHSDCQTGVEWMVLLVAEGHRSEAPEYPGTHRRDILQTPSSITCQLRQDEKHWPGTPEGLSGALGRSITLMSKVRSPGLLVKSTQRTSHRFSFLLLAPRAH